MDAEGLPAERFQGNVAVTRRFVLETKVLQQEKRSKSAEHETKRRVFIPTGSSCESTVPPNHTGRTKNHSCHVAEATAAIK